MVAAADVVLHAGDIKTDEFLDRLASTVVNYTVAGDDVDMTMVHDAGPALGRARRMRRRFPDAALVVFGHSHVPLDVLGADGQRLFNPGHPPGTTTLQAPVIGERSAFCEKSERARRSSPAHRDPVRYSREMQSPRAGFAGPDAAPRSRRRGPGGGPALPPLMAGANDGDGCSSGANGLVSDDGELAGGDGVEEWRRGLSVVAAGVVNGVGGDGTIERVVVAHVSTNGRGVPGPHVGPSGTHAAPAERTASAPWGPISSTAADALPSQSWRT